MAEVSVIIPVYNVENYVDRCLESVTSQTFSNIEIIIVNDGSTDRSGEKCLEWANHDDRIIYVSKKNEGAGPARNLGIQMASAEFVAFCDPDDWYDERFIKIMLAKQRETDADIVVCNWHRYDGDLDRVIYTDVFENFNQAEPYWAWRLAHALWMKLFRKSLFIENNIKMPSCLGQDTAIHSFIMTKAQKVVLAEQALYYWFNRPGSATNSHIRHTSDTVQIMAHIWNLFIRDGTFEEHKKELLFKAFGLINVWYPIICSNVEYTNKWLSDCMKAIKEYFGDMVNIYMLSICIVGSYSLFNCIPRCLPKPIADRKATNEYCFSGLISYTSGKQAVSPIVDNPFRQTAIEHDFQKTLVQDISLKQFDYIILDFLDERFDIAEANGGYYTISDAFEEADTPFSYITFKRGDIKMVEIWEKKCLEFIALLKEKFPTDRVVLVKNFLAETFGTTDNRKSFDNINEIRQANAIIAKCYDFFEANCPGIKVIDLSKGEIFYSDENFRHGCAPWHYNQEYYLTMRELIYDYLKVS